jgi:hypothetical protein
MMGFAANTNGYRFWSGNAAESSYEGFYDGEEEAPQPPPAAQSFHDEIVAICQDTGISSIAAGALSLRYPVFLPG